MHGYCGQNVQNGECMTLYGSQKLIKSCLGLSSDCSTPFIVAVIVAGSPSLSASSPNVHSLAATVDGEMAPAARTRPKKTFRTLTDNPPLIRHLRPVRDHNNSATALSYDPKTRVGRLDIVAGGCCDMSGCVAAFERVDDQVQRIETYSGSKPAAVYLRRHGRWSAMQPVA